MLQHWDRLQGYLADYTTYALPAVLAALALLFRMSDTLSKTILEKIPFFSRALRRFLSGKDYIEGDWPLVVIDMAKQELLYLGFLRIVYSDGQLCVSGNDWYPDGNHAQAFRSMQSLYRDRTLRYWYEQGASPYKMDMRGYTEIYFFPAEGLAKRHAGKFLDTQHISDIRFYAKKHRYRPFQRRFGPEDVNEKLAAAREVWAQLEPRLVQLRDRSFSADFV